MRSVLPAVPDDAEVELDVIDGEIVSKPGTRTVIVFRPIVQVVQVVQIGRVVARHEHTRKVARHGAYVAAGMIVAARRWHASRTRHERMMRSAEAAGDHAAALDWAKLAELERHQKHERRVKRVEAALAVAVGLPVIGAAWLVSMVLLGVLLWIGGAGPRGMAWPWVTMAHVVAFGVQVAPTLALVAVVGVPLAAVLALYHTGLHAGDFAPSWITAQKPGRPDSPPCGRPTGARSPRQLPSTR